MTKRYRNISDLPVDISKIVFKYDYYLTGKRKLIFEDKEGVSNAFLLSDNRLVLTSVDGIITIIDLKTNKLQLQFEPHESESKYICSLPNGLFATSSYDKKIKIWDSNELRDKLTFNKHIDFMDSLPDGRIIFRLFTDKMVNIWNVGISVLEPLISVNEDDKIFLCSQQLIFRGSKIQTVYDIINKKSFSINIQDSWNIKKIYLALPNNHLLFNVSNYEIEIWDLNSQMRKKQFTMDDEIQSIALLPNNNLLIRLLNHNTDRIVSYNLETLKVESILLETQNIVKLLDNADSKIVFVEKSEVYILV